MEFGEVIAADVVAAVAALDRRLAAHPFPGFIEAIPAFASLMVCFDPLVADHDSVIAALDALLAQPHDAADDACREVEIEVCYDGDDLAPDLDALAAMQGLDAQAAVAAHLRGEYRVVMYGFAPGFAYMSGAPSEIAAPRKAQAIRNVPAGTVIVAAGMCIVTTIVMPTGWWRIGRSPTAILRPHDPRPFLFEAGDRVRFRRITREEFAGAGRRTQERRWGGGA
ncbi:MAG: carboxyltransferase domain-containing protein [Rhodoblastus sp.]|nr:MAG: carboxyltransferase domain-containing protein [Rhodoblastus sp.]